MIIIRCKNCNKEIKTYPSRAGRKNFCSRSCNASFNLKGNSYNVGNTYWLGKKHKLESIEKIKAAKTGVRLSVDTEFKKGCIPWNKGIQGLFCNDKFIKDNPTKRGADSHLWKGGLTPINTKVRNSAEYSNWRKAIFIRDNYTCLLCGKVGGKIQADHIKSFSNYPELRLNILNGRTLCFECHKNTPNYAGRVRKEMENVL